MAFQIRVRLRSGLRSAELLGEVHTPFPERLAPAFIWCHIRRIFVRLELSCLSVEEDHSLLLVEQRPVADNVDEKPLQAFPSLLHRVCGEPPEVGLLRQRWYDDTLAVLQQLLSEPFELPVSPLDLAAFLRLRIRRNDLVHSVSSHHTRTPRHWVLHLDAEHPVQDQT